MTRRIRGGIKFCKMEKQRVKGRVIQQCPQTRCLLSLPSCHGADETGQGHTGLPVPASPSYSSPRGTNKKHTGVLSCHFMTPRPCLYDAKRCQAESHRTSWRLAGGFATSLLCPITKCFLSLQRLVLPSPDARRVKSLPGKSGLSRLHLISVKRSA